MSRPRGAYFPGKCYALQQVSFLFSIEKLYRARTASPERERERIKVGGYILLGEGHELKACGKMVGADRWVINYLSSIVEEVC